MKTVQELLEEAGGGGTVTEDDWPRLRDYIFERLDTISTSEFPRLPNASQETQTQSQALPSSPVLKNDLTNSQDIDTTDKENAPPSDGAPVRSSSSLPGIDFLQPHIVPYNIPNPLETISGLQSSIRHTLIEDFPQHPPYTIQRLAELILQPKQHYRFLPSYLQALYRVISVSTNSSLFPLQNQVNPTPSGLLVNGTTENGLGSDESLGGALLTPIPWLANRTPSPTAVDSPHSIPRTLLGADQDLELHSEGTQIIHGPNGTGSIETVSVVGGGVRTAPGSASSVLSSSRQLQDVTGEEASETSTAAEDDEVPHARGPPEIGIEDTGPQTGRGGVAGILSSLDGPGNPQETQSESANAEDSSMDVDNESND